MNILRITLVIIFLSKKRSINRDQKSANDPIACVQSFSAGSVKKSKTN